MCALGFVETRQVHEYLVTLLTAVFVTFWSVIGREEGVRATNKVPKLTDTLIHWTMGHSTIDKCEKWQLNTEEG
jgi:hypothetical protein